MSEITLPAKTENLIAVNDFVTAELEAYSCPMNILMEIELAVEEIFVNIANYAYQTGEGFVTVRCRIDQEPLQAIIQFMDSGVPYDPLARSDPDTTLPAEERELGGLGVMLVKKLMDSVDYKFKDGNNILTVKKLLK